MIDLRDYQQRALDLIIEDLFNDYDFAICMHGGSGKSIVIAALVKYIVENWDGRVLMMVDSRKLVIQNFDALKALWPNAPVGRYVSSLYLRQLNDQITYAMMQSIRPNADKLGHYDIVIVDEAHAINNDNIGGYRNIINHVKKINPLAKVVGFSATLHRLGQGTLIEGDDALFSKIIESHEFGATIKDLLDQGYLSPLTSPKTRIPLDTDGLTIARGDYQLGQMQTKWNTPEINHKLAKHMVENRSDRNHWLIFCSGVQHCKDFAETLNNMGVTATHLTQEDKDDKKIEAFERGEYRALCNFGKLTKGYDFRPLDYIALIRKTASPALYEQIIVRGMRIHESKTNCMVDDFCGNVETHGPVIDIRPPRRKGDKKEDAPVKPCPECDELLPISIMKCYTCGYEFPPAEAKVELTEADIMGINKNLIHISVDWWDWSVHTSRTSGKEMIKCSYYPDDLSGPVIREYLCITHEGFAGQKALAELSKIANSTGAMDVYKADDLQQVCDILNQADAPTKVEYEKNGKFYNVKRRIWEDPQPVEVNEITTDKGEEESWLDTEPPF